MQSNTDLCLNIPNSSSITNEELFFVEKLETETGDVEILSKIHTKQKPLLIEMIGSVLISNKLSNQIELKQGEVCFLLFFMVGEEAENTKITRNKPKQKSTNKNNKTQNKT